MKIHSAGAGSKCKLSPPPSEEEIDATIKSFWESHKDEFNEEGLLANSLEREQIINNLIQKNMDEIRFLKEINTWKYLKCILRYRYLNNEGKFLLKDQDQMSDLGYYEHFIQNNLFTTIKNYIHTKQMKNYEELIGFYREELMDKISTKGFTQGIVSEMITFKRTKTFFIAKFAKIIGISVKTFEEELYNFIVKTQFFQTFRDYLLQTKMYEPKTIFSTTLREKLDTIWGVERGQIPHYNTGNSTVYYLNDDEFIKNTFQSLQNYTLGNLVQNIYEEMSIETPLRGIVRVRMPNGYILGTIVSKNEEKYIIEFDSGGGQKINQEVDQKLVMHPRKFKVTESLVKKAFIDRLLCTFNTGTVKEVVKRVLGLYYVQINEMWEKTATKEFNSDNNIRRLYASDEQKTNLKNPNQVLFENSKNSSSIDLDDENLKKYSLFDVLDRLKESKQPKEPLIPVEKGSLQKYVNKYIENQEDQIADSLRSVVHRNKILEWFKDKVFSWYEESINEIISEQPKTWKHLEYIVKEVVAKDFDRNDMIRSIMQKRIEISIQRGEITRDFGEDKGEKLWNTVKKWEDSDKCYILTCSDEVFLRILLYIGDDDVKLNVLQYAKSESSDHITMLINKIKQNQSEEALEKRLRQQKIENKEAIKQLCTIRTVQNNGGADEEEGYTNHCFLISIRDFLNQKRKTPVDVHTLRVDGGYPEGQLMNKEFDDDYKPFDFVAAAEKIAKKYCLTIVIYQKVTLPGLDYYEEQFIKKHDGIERVIGDVTHKFRGKDVQNDIVRIAHTFEEGGIEHFEWIKGITSCHGIKADDFKQQEKEQIQEIRRNQGEILGDEANEKIVNGYDEANEIFGDDEPQRERRERPSLQKYKIRPSRKQIRDYSRLRSRKQQQKIRKTSRLRSRKQQQQMQEKIRKRMQTEPQQTQTTEQSYSVPMQIDEDDSDNDFEFVKGGFGRPKHKTMSRIKNKLLNLFRF